MSAARRRWTPPRPLTRHKRRPSVPLAPNLANNWESEQLKIIHSGISYTCSNDRGVIRSWGSPGHEPADVAPRFARRRDRAGSGDQDRSIPRSPMVRRVRTLVRGRPQDVPDRSRGHWAMRRHISGVSVYTHRAEHQTRRAVPETMKKTESNRRAARTGKLGR